jgi:WXG100 family type VII secretion target
VHRACSCGGYAVLDASREVGVVPEPLEVDPIDLHISAGHMSVHHADLRAAHAEADSDIEGAQAGWVGTSAAALQAKLAEWQATTEQLCGNIADHEQAFRAAAQKYTTVDGESADHLNDQL